MVSVAKLRIAEIFTSIQGEGGWVGIPSVFVRISGCNLRCDWCDTPYASWNPEGEFFEVDALVERVTAENLKHVVVTGGEPMLFEATEELCSELVLNGHTVTIETAGTVFRDVACDLMSISPKLANSTPDDPVWTSRHEATRADLGPLKHLIDTYSYQLKFVVNSESDLDGQLLEIETLLDAVGADRQKVILMAEGIDSETLHRRERLLVPHVIRLGYRLTPRLHVDLFGNTRGT